MMPQLLSLMEHMADKFNNRAHTAAIFNISKAYDTVWTTGMIEITHSWNTGLIILLLALYLTGQKFRVKMEGRMEINTCKYPPESM
jgi:hypothetical protein